MVIYANCIEKIMHTEFGTNLLKWIKISRVIDKFMDLRSFYYSIL